MYTFKSLSSLNLSRFLTLVFITLASSASSLGRFWSINKPLLGRQNIELTFCICVIYIFFLA